MEAGVQSLRLAIAQGAQIAYGSDLLGDMHQDQLTGIELHARVQTPAQVIASLTTVPAKLFQMEGKVRTLQAPQ